MFIFYFFFFRAVSLFSYSSLANVLLRMLSMAVSYIITRIIITTIFHIILFIEIIVIGALIIRSRENAIAYYRNACDNLHTCATCCVCAQIYC